jgi:hypothetical protein
MNGSGKVIGIAITLFVLWITWASSKLVSIDRRVTFIEANRYTTQDALTHASLDGHLVMIERVGAIQEQLNRIERGVEELVGGAGK